MIDLMEGLWSNRKYGFRSSVMPRRPYSKPWGPWNNDFWGTSTQHIEVRKKGARRLDWAKSPPFPFILGLRSPY